MRNEPDGGAPLTENVDGAGTDASTSGGPSYGDISEAWLLGRARELVAVNQRTDPDTQRDIIEELDELLAEARRRAEPMTVGQLLRSAILARVVVPFPVETIDPLADELLDHANRHKLVVLEAGAHALRARRHLLIGNEDDAITEVARALALLEEEDQLPDRPHGRRASQRVLSGVLIDIALAMTELGVYEVADQVMGRADLVVEQGGGPHEIAIHLINRVRLQLGWALRQERVGNDADARRRIATASGMADAAEGPFAKSLFPRDVHKPAADQLAILGAAHALATPGPAHLERLYALLESATQAHEIITLTVALARCLAEDDRVDEALGTLADVREQLAEETSEQVLRLSLIREFARLSGPDGGERTTSALEDYAAELEVELWATRDSRIATLTTRREHALLSKEHGAIAIAAMQDPLTGLANRRALDEHLDALMTRSAGTPVAIALVDLDGFKGVNDRASHAEGDDVLRVVASTLRNALRGDDLVARYGGDEFVALLPGAPLSAAEAALSRAVHAVAELPIGLSHGVTLSVGVVALRPNETAASVLARADAAMYLAKRSGGNAVTAEPTPGTAPASEVTGRTWMLPDSAT